MSIKNIEKYKSFERLKYFNQLLYFCILLNEIQTSNVNSLKECPP